MKKVKGKLMGFDTFTERRVLEYCQCGKAIYSSRRDASDAALQMNEKKMARGVHPYQCAFPNWHIGHSDRGRKS